MTAIVYESNTGTAKRYAEALAAKTGLPCFAANRVDPAVDDAVFLGWVLGGEIRGLRQLRESGVNVKAVGAVGIMVQDAAQVREKNCGDGEAFFFLPGAFDMKKLKGMYKLMMGMIVKAIKAKVKEKPGADSETLLGFFENGIDLFSEDALQELTDYLTA